MIFPDTEFARRHERAAMAIESEYARSYASLCPDLDIEIARVADGVAIFTGVGSPLSQATGLGMDGPVAEADVEAVESVYFRRGAAARVVVCPMSDPSLVATLGCRGYRISEFEQVLMCPLSEPGVVAMEPGLEVRRVGGDESDLYIGTVGPNFAENGRLTPELREMMAPFFAMKGTAAFLVSRGGNPAGGGALLIHEGLAMLAGAGTLPPHRNRGVHAAIFLARLEHAWRSGCDLAVMGAAPGSGSQKNAERKGFRVAYTKVVLSRSPG